MAQSNPTRGPEVEDRALAEEIAAIPYEPLLPVERKLVAGSLLLGLALLGLLWWASAALFPIPTVPR